MAVTGGSGALPTVVIVGAGAAGVFTAYQITKHWPGQFDVRLFEASPVVGGNVSSLNVEYGGQSYAIDAGAQFFYAKAQPPTTSASFTSLAWTIGWRSILPA